jgi:hypothetical protein
MSTYHQTTSPLKQAREEERVLEVSCAPKTETKEHSSLTKIIPFSAHFSEQWLLERTYHAQLRSSMELSVPDLTLAMRQLSDFDVPHSKQSCKSKLAEKMPVKKSANFYVPIATWREITYEEAHAAYQEGIPILLYGEHSWEHHQGAPMWSANRNMREIISRTAREHPVANYGTDYAVCYCDRKQGTFSNAVWKAWFSSDSTIFDGGDHSTITFLAPCVQFPSIVHYTVITSEGHLHEYADRDAALQGFSTLPPQEVNTEGRIQTVFPQLCYYCEVTCPTGVYRLEFFGPHMDKQGYQVKEAA